MDGDFDEEDKHVSNKLNKKEEESFPSLISNCMPNNVVKPIRNYAAVLIAPAPKIEVAPKVVDINLLVSKAEQKNDKKIKIETDFNYNSRQAPWAYASNKIVPKNNWAAMVESDDEDDAYSDYNDYSSNYDEIETNYDY